MKRLITLVIIVLLMGALYTSCSQHTCPAYGGPTQDARR